MIILENRKGAGRKPSPPNLLKIPICLKLPRWLTEWMAAQPVSRAVLVERALCEKYGLTPPEAKK